MMKLVLATFALLISINYSQTLWTYDPDLWRPVYDVTLRGTGTYSSFNGNNQLSWANCKQECLTAGLNCVSFTWTGDTDVDDLESSDQDDNLGNCNLFSVRFGFANEGFELVDGKIGEGNIAEFEFSGGTTYYEKPMDIDDTLKHHLISRALKLNNVDYATYELQEETNGGLIDYDQFLLYYRAGQPGYVNQTEQQATSKYSVILEKEGIESAEECAKYCTRNRGAIDEDLGTRCISFNYNDKSNLCHLLSFAHDGVNYFIDTDTIPGDNREDANDDWEYYEGLVGEGCWIVQSQCRKWDDSSYVTEQANNKRLNRSLHQEIGVDIGVIREYAFDPNPPDIATERFTKEFEYVCMDKARFFHEEKCDNDVDRATVAYWAQDGAGVAEIWNSWDFTEGCVIDLSENPFDGEPSSFDCIIKPDTEPNPRFSGKKFRDSIGEEEFAAGVDKKRCFERANQYYNECQIAEQATSDERLYLKVTWATDGTYYLSPAIPCGCDDYGKKIESTFGLKREYCTRDLSEPFCYREEKEDYWEGYDLLCDDVTDPTLTEREVNECGVTGNGVNPIANGETGCYLFYPQPSNDQKTAINYECSGGGKYKFDDAEEWTEVNFVKYKPLKCNDVDESDDPCLNTDIIVDLEYCRNYAEKIHDSCGNGLEDESEQIIMWYRPTGEITTFPDYESPYETTVTRGFTLGTTYTEDLSGSTIIDFMPIRNGRWQTFTAEKSGSLRQINVYYQNEKNATLSMTVWSGSGVTESVFLNEVTIEAQAQGTGFIGFPLDDITLTAGDYYTWQVTSSSDDVDFLGDLGYVRGNGYDGGIGDLAWDYLFSVWIEGDDTENAAMAAIVTPGTDKRPWFEIWCIMIIVLFIIFLVFLCLLHWKRIYDEKQERKEDKKFQAELRERARLQAEAERNAKLGNAEYDDEYEDGSDYDENERHGRDNVEEEEEEDYDEENADTRFEQNDEDGDGGGGDTKSGNYLSPGGKDYKRVKSASKNEMQDDSDNGIDGYQDPDEEPTRKKKKKKKKKPKRKKSSGDYEQYED